jgi:hypothetical protein
MARSLRLLFIAWLAITWVPGASEMVEDAAHFALVTATVHAHGHDASPEHGCAPTGHHCSCCASLVAVRPPTPSTVLPPASARQVSALLPDGRARAGVPTRVIRPPTA